MDLSRNSPLIPVLLAALVILAVVTGAAAVYVAWLLSGYLVTGMLVRVFVTIGILGLLSSPNINQE